MPPAADAACIEQACVFTQADFDAFARLSGDHNPIHVDPAFAAGTPFGATVSHGMLLFSRLRALLARRYPGARLLAQSLKFPAPSYAGEALRLRLAPGALTADGVLTLHAEIVKPDGRRGLQGECRLQLPPEGA